jgi:hypothetical protein
MPSLRATIRRAIGPGRRETQLRRDVTVHRNRSIHGASLLLCTAVATCALAGCGGKAATTAGVDTHREPVAEASKGKLSPAAVTAAAAIERPGAVVARVGSHTLTQGALQQLVGAEVAAQIPQTQVAFVPPLFTACVAKVESNATATFDSASGSGSPSYYKQACKQRYAELRTQALKQWIVNEWVAHGADEAGVPINDREVLAAYKRGVLEASPSVAQFEKELPASGRTKQGILRQIRASLANARIRAKIHEESKIGPADVRAYYLAHKAHYYVAQSRDLKIFRTRTRAEAERAKREIERGRSFASLAKASSLPQPIYSKAGSVHALKSGVYHESALNQAIFRAKPDVLSGPVKINLGWYVFEVKRIRHPYQRPFDAVAKTIEGTLPESREKQKLAAFIRRWRAKWRSQTSCSPGYVLDKCREFKPGKGTVPEDPYTFA